MPVIIFLIAYILFLFGMGIYLLIQGVRSKKRFGKVNYLFSVRLKLASGMNLPAGTICKTHCLRNELVMEANGQEFHLDNEKMICASIMKNTEIQRQYVSSAGGALAGALIAGPLGALIGGGPSQKKVRLKRKYLVIAYEGKENPQYILFDATYAPSFANRLSNHYKYLRKRDNIRVDL